jgi:hypothetical protein
VLPGPDVCHRQRLDRQRHGPDWLVNDAG